MLVQNSSFGNCLESSNIHRVLDPVHRRNHKPLSLSIIVCKRMDPANFYHGQERSADGGHDAAPEEWSDINLSLHPKRLAPTFEISSR
mmetsp:Transcript_34099/g.81612  ORF Transcript_34099/g.81612 Transcript_34099/m.81612 type:complete len:88 (+) Transcript_34099:106-369(+)